MASDEEDDGRKEGRETRYGFNSGPEFWDSSAVFSRLTSAPECLRCFGGLFSELNGGDDKSFDRFDMSFSLGSFVTLFIVGESTKEEDADDEDAFAGGVLRAAYLAAFLLQLVFSLADNPFHRSTATRVMSEKLMEGKSFFTSRLAVLQKRR